MNPYIFDDLFSAQRHYGPSENAQFESEHNTTKSKRKKKHDNDKNYKNVWDADRSSSDEEEEDELEDEELYDRQLRGNFENTEKLVTFYLREHKEKLKMDIPECIGIVCLQYSFEPTNVIFHEYDKRISHYISIENNGKMCKITSRTVFVFSKDGYNSGHHIWHVKCHRVYNCQALGICEHKNSKYRYGDNIFDVALNRQLGDRYIYAGDSGHSWRGSNELRPYVSSVIDEEEFYTKRLELQNGRWCVGDIITVDLDLGSGRKDDDSKRTITFYKNGKRLAKPIRVVKRCMYYPVFQVYQRGTFEIIDDISTEPIYQPEENKVTSSEDEGQGSDDGNDGVEELPAAPPKVVRHKSLDSEDEDSE